MLKKAHWRVHPVLDPYQRLQLVSELRPPDGYEFELGIGTTFSLDLESMLTVPLSLALCEFESKEDALRNPEAILEGLRRIAGKLHIFCHKGRIKRPKEGTVLFSFLEGMLVQSLPRNESGAFHAKVWLLRYRREGEAILRVLVLSRNLTFDKSWDTAVVLEGPVQFDRASGVRKNRRLAQFITALGELSGDAGDQARSSLKSLSDSVMQTEFEIPEGFDDIAFWPLGIGGDIPKVLDQDHGRLMIVSPFLSDLSDGGEVSILDFLTEKRSRVTDNVLVSRSDQLDALRPESIAALRESTRIYVFDDAAISADKAAQDAPPERAIDDLSGLHAKVYVVENGASVSVLAGSANATRAAWGTSKDEGKNVEFVIELMGARRTVGINALLGVESGTEVGSAGMLKMLKPYNSPEVPVEQDKDERRVEELIENCWRQLANAPMSVSVKKEDEDNYCAQLSIPPLMLADEVKCQTWPVMLNSARAQRITSDSTLDFGGISIFAITPLWAFRLEVKVRKVEQFVEFVLKLPVENMPEGRSAAIMSSMINNSDRFLRYLALLLSDDPTEPGQGILSNEPSRGQGDSDPQASWGNAVLLENLVKAYSRNPKRLERVESLIADLKKGKSTEKVIPPEFEEIWQAFGRGQA